MPLICFTINSFSQDSLKGELLFGQHDGIKKVSDSTLFNKKLILSPQQKKKRIWLVAGGNLVGYGTAMIGLYSAWYKDFPEPVFIPSMIIKNGCRWTKWATCTVAMWRAAVAWNSGAGQALTGKNVSGSAA